MASRSANSCVWRRWLAIACLALAMQAVAGGPDAIRAENTRERTFDQPRRPAAPSSEDQELPPAGDVPAAVDIAPMTGGDSLSRSVEGGELAPVPVDPADQAPMEGGDGGLQLPPSPGLAPALPLSPAPATFASSSPRLPRGLWRGLEAREVEEHFAKLSVPPLSPTLFRLWRALLVDEPDGQDAERLLALRLEGLSRSGLVEDAGALAGRASEDMGNPILVSALIRTHLARGETRDACAGVKRLPLKDAKLPKRVRSEGLATAALCAALSKDPEAARLGAKVLAGAGIEAPIGRAVLEALASGGRPRLPAEGAVGLVDEALLRLVQPVEVPEIYARAAPDAAVAAATDEAADAIARAHAGEAAIRTNAIAPGTLAALYQTVELAPEDRQNPLASSLEGAAKRALLYQATIGERSAVRKARNARALLDEARRDRLHVAAAEMLADAIADLPLSPEIAWFAESAVEINLAAGRYRPAAAWAEFGSTVAGERPDGLLHWLTLVDIADADGNFRHGSSLRHAEALALSGGFPPGLLPRLASVLDALQYDIPIPLWEAASREGQPEKGHLPETGVLSALQQAAANGDTGRTILLALRAIGPGGADQAHLLALGDVIRSLKAAGLEAEARRLGFEALFEDWPRRASG